MSSGIDVNSKVLEAYNALQLQHNYKYVIFKLSDDLKQIEVETTKKNYDGFAWKDFTDQLPPCDVRYAVVDFHFNKKSDGAKQEKVIFVHWAPDNAPIKRKMLIASSKDALKRKLEGLSLEVQANDMSDLLEEEIIAKLDRT
ncbi:DgyrCDS4673 [Dimorphilus gyrociliatus]|uniref:DgyrCDS4673 n=1 Tax=Dimorphilus gyrociliatus TaxID=2664684 RepID=A0A7I8VHB0_9ANNE|nr:DgyrCDS4673 [Dimorphilus gyrociliatus]